MDEQMMFKNIFSVLNVFIITYLMMNQTQDTNHKNRHFHMFCFSSTVLLRIFINYVSIHILYHYMVIIVICIIIGRFVFQQSLKYCLLIGRVFLSIVLLGQLLSCIFFYRYNSNEILADLPARNQIEIMIFAELVIIVGSLMIKGIVKKIPLLFAGIHMFTILLPLFINIIVMAIAADLLYYEKKLIVDNASAVVTVIAASIAMFMGTICNIVILENFLNVKNIENQKNLQISEISMQYDYYVRQSKDMENIRKLSHDIKNHLEALKENIDYQQKIDYIDGIERKLNIYQSYYKTGNTFIDNVLHAKRLEALENNIEFKVFADFTVFRTIKNEDLCVIVSNTVDNALRECQLMKAENPKTECLIQLKAKKRKGFLSIVCENSLRKSQAELLRTNITMKTSKEDKINHGFGVRNIKDIVKEYDGEVVFHVIDDMFSVSIIIPMHMI